MIYYIFKCIKRKSPVITILFVMSCLITTIPQFFLSDIYNIITGSAYLQNFIYFTLPNFSHTPDTLIPHLIGNLIVFLFLGSVVEILIGSSRFALISTVTLFTTVLFHYFRAANATHGASGICWGYHIFVFFILILYWEKKRLSVFKDIFIYIFIFIFIFDFLVIPALEVFVMKLKFAENFGQYIHLASNIVLIPFLFLWRKEIEFSFNAILTKKEIVIKKFKFFPIIVAGLVLMLNLTVTVIAIITTVKYKPPSYSINPPSGTGIDKIRNKIIINFDKDMELNSEKETGHSIHYTSSEIPEYKVYWKNNKSLEIHFSRSFKKGEYVILDFTIKEKFSPIIVPLHIEYK